MGAEAYLDLIQGLRRWWAAARWREVLPAVLLLVALLVARFRFGLSPGGLGGLICALLCLYYLRQGRGDQRVYIALAAGCAAWSIGALLGNRPAVALPLSWLEGGVFTFAAGATLASLAWPEIRRGNLRLAATLIDALTVVAAVGMWGSAGFPPLTAWLPDITLQASARSVSLLVPLVTALVVLPQLSAARRPGGVAVGVAAAALALGDLPLAEIRTSGVASVLQAIGFVVLAWGIWKIAANPPGARLSWPDAFTPPGLVPGLVGTAAFGLTALVARPALPAAAAALGACIVARALLGEWDRRRAQRRLDATFEIGARLAEVSEEGPGVRGALAEVCDAVAEALRADTTMVWIKEADALSLLAAGPMRLSELMGVRSGTLEDGDITALVSSTGRPSICDRVTWGKHLPRGVAQAVGAEALLAAPITREGQTFGVLVLGRHAGAPVFSGSDQWKASLVGAQVAGVLHQARRHRDLSRELKQTNLVHRFATESVRAGSLNEVGTLLLATIRDAAQFDRGSVRLADRSAPGGLRAVAHLSEGITLEAARANLRLPLHYRSTTVGEVLLERAAGRPFTRFEETAAEALCRFAAQPLHNHYLREETDKVSDLQDQGRAKTDLLRAVSHDLRGPLTVIKGYAESLASADDDMSEEERLLSLRTIEEEVDHLTELLNHMLDLSAIEAGRLSLEPQVVRLGRLVDQALASARCETHAFYCEVGAELMVTADRSRLREVLDNLIGNAVKYSPEGGGIEVRAAQNQGEVTISVSDNGIGIPRHLLQRVFQPFERDSRGSGRGIMGTGLGLAIVKGLVEAHGGRIWVESEPGQGSTFYFTLPAAPELDIVAS